MPSFTNALLNFCQLSQQIPFIAKFPNQSLTWHLFVIPSLVSSDLEQFLSLFLNFYDHGSFEDYGPVTLKSFPQFRFVCFLIIRLKWCIFGTNTTGTMLCFHCIFSGGIEFQYIPLLVMLILITWFQASPL